MNWILSMRGLSLTVLAVSAFALSGCSKSEPATSEVVPKVVRSQSLRPTSTTVTVVGGVSSTASRKENALCATHPWYPSSRRKAIGAMNTIAPNLNASFAVPHGSRSLLPATKPRPVTNHLNQKNEIVGPE